MKPSVMCILCVFMVAVGLAQDVIPLYPDPAPGPPQENYPEKYYFSDTWQTDVVTNVTKPSLTLFKPAPGSADGSAVVICPGGGFMALSITSEGTDVAKWLAARGVTAFVLKYRLARTGDDGTKEFAALIGDREKFSEMVSKVIPLSLADGLAAMTYVRRHASEWGLSPERVGIIGFSAGGTVAAGVGFGYTAEVRPAFIAPIYAAAAGFKDRPVPADAPPMFLAAASDDRLGLAMDTIGLYDQWKALTNPLSCICTRKVATGSGCESRGCLPINGLTGSANGSKHKAG